MLDAAVLFLASLGIRSDLAIASGFGAAFLVLARNLTPRQAMAAVAGGVGTAVYLSAILVRALVRWAPDYILADVLTERAVALLWGLGGSFILAGVIVLGERWKKDPLQTIKDLKP